MLFSRKQNINFLDSIPSSARETERWDREWINYLNTEDPRPFLIPYDNLHKEQAVIDNFSKLSEAEILDVRLCQELPALRIWIPGSDLVNKKVLEIGCGPGFLGKQMGLVAQHYLGIDYSKLALSIAKLVSPNNCNYIHISERQNILKYANSIDTMVGRFFFIHQNFDNAIWLLKLAHILLKSGGVVSADFYKPTSGIEQGIVFPAKHNLSSQYPSCAFEYSQLEIQELAAQCGFKIASTHHHLEMQRLFVRFEK
ncbi:class I SAM-dependent methyltransferase [Calothrix sp. 336/3]|uniref:class I SAM-dependent methyltransferase n=1 Tax=Calothrix sp. 336/3 TaxID=1337936 RepID=UPI0004E2EDE4|nr:class I SAM-dependent methyltransferase [Calothrix sp. 336/3]AKG22718.1 hypothetical protein IJ00_16830 [Calothrix sp. 336/3]